MICCWYCDADHFLSVFPYYNFQDNNQQMQNKTQQFISCSGGHLEFSIDKKSTETLKRTIQGTSLPSLIPNGLVVSEISEKIKMWHANDDGRMPCDGISLHDPFGSERSNELKVIFYLYVDVLVKIKIKSPIK